MIDTITGRTVRVSEDRGWGSRIIVRYARLEEVTKLLDEHKISYEVDDETLSVDDEPEVAFVRIEEGSDTKLIQQLLDSLP